MTMGKKPVQPRDRPTLIITRRRSRPGVCRWCRCSDFDPCPEGCGWANAAHRLCTACVDVAKAWVKLHRVQGSDPRNGALEFAFFRGYMVGSEDERAEHGITGTRGERAVAGDPYPAKSNGSRYWTWGRDAGRRAAQYV